MTIPRRTLLTAFAGAAACSAARAPAAEPPSGDADEVSFIEQFGVSWTFDRPYQAGRYAQGDWWVVGPVDVISIAPQSTSGARVTNGAMINPEGDVAVQGYDSAMYGEHAEGRYDASLNAALDVNPASPLALSPGSSLISCISELEAGARPQLRTAAVLTVVDAPPPDGSFRPPYCGADKTHRHTVFDLDRRRLGALRAAPGAPALATLEAGFERPWLDHVSGWLGRYLHPADNMPDYGRDMAATIGDAALMLNVDLPIEHKELLLRRFVQLGVDLHGVAEAGGGWPPDGGHGSGRKLPILVAGLLLGDDRMLDIAQRDTAFGEDAQTFYVAQSSGGAVNGGHGAYRREHVGLPEWGVRHATDPSKDDASWDAPYRECCTANAWVGAVLAAHVMGLRERWGHEALFDYQDRYMAAEHAEPWLRSKSLWAGAMWDLHRGDYSSTWPGKGL